MGEIANSAPPNTAVRVYSHHLLLINNSTFKNITLLGDHYLCLFVRGGCTGICVLTDAIGIRKALFLYRSEAGKFLIVMNL